MNVISRLFLTAKHWQIFFLFVGLTVVAQIAAISSLEQIRSPEDFGVGSSFSIVMSLFMLCFLGWFWAMGSFLNTNVPALLRPSISFFRFSLIYPACYFFAFIAFAGNLMPTLFAIIFLFHLFAMFCMFYSLVFVVKNLVLVELGRPVSFYDYAGLFFLLWFFPIGVWMIQPRINHIYALKGNSESVGGTGGS